MGCDSPVPSVWSSGSKGRSEGPRVWQRWCCRAQGSEHQPPLSHVNFFSSSQPLDLHTSTLLQTHNAQSCMHDREEQERLPAHPVWPPFTLTAHDKKEHSGSLVFLFCCCFSSDGDLILFLFVLFSVLAWNTDLHKTTSWKLEMVYWF